MDKALLLSDVTQRFHFPGHMLPLFSALSYFSATTVSTSLFHTTLHDFGFEANATFRIEFTDLLMVTEYAFALLTNRDSDAFSRLLTEKADSLAGCTNLSLFGPYSYTFRPLDKRRFSLNGTISAKSVLTPTILNCHAPIGTIRISETYASPATLLDFRHLKTLKLKYIPIVVNVIILVLWLMNWLRFPRICIPLRHFHTAILICGVLAPSIRLRELSVLNTSDADGGLTNTRIVFSIFAEALLFATLLLTAKGWCIVRDTLEVSEVIRSIVYSFAYITFALLLTERQYFGWRMYFLAGLVMVSSGFFIVELVISINRASLHILAHLLVISHAGIAPGTTPVYQKHRMYHCFQFSVVAFCALLMAKLIISIVVRVDYWIDELIGNLLRSGIYATLAALLRLRGNEAGEYTSIAEAPTEMALSELEALGLDPDNIPEGGGIPWEEGMRLPGRPVIVERTSLVTLSSPDGTTSNLVFTEEGIDDKT
jgi:hypothetical protein